MKKQSGRKDWVLFAQAMPMTLIFRATGAVHSTKDRWDRGGLAQTDCSYATPYGRPARRSTRRRLSSRLNRSKWLSLRVSLGPWSEIPGLLC